MQACNLLHNKQAAANFSQAEKQGYNLRDLQPDTDRLASRLG
jgi:hypothetical protein